LDAGHRVRLGHALAREPSIAASHFGSWWKPVPSSEKRGQLLVDVKAGPAIGLHDSGGAGRPAFSTAAVGVDVGVAVTPDRRGYVVVSPQVQPGAWYIAYMLPVGFEYD
jgi:hypothetical protein